MTIAGGLPTRPPLHDLARHGDATAVVTADVMLSHRELDALVEARAAVLGGTRRLVMLECANELEPLVTYLAALRGGHPVLLMPAQDGVPARRHAQRVLDLYAPDVVVRRTGSARAGGWALEELRPGTAHDLHPDLAVLLGTSGSTGTPKLVRLSHENLRSNAEAIADYLELGPHSRAATTLPLQYCYGLSVVNSHLHAGGSVWLTDRSVVDPAFWEGFVGAGATSLAGVPYTFELLDRSGVDWITTPGLRQVTQAGGRMAPEQVRRTALAAESASVDLFVMYGQTEATARMAYLPPRMAADRPSCIGVPIHGGDFRLDEGELVYTGPNVMMGYAETPQDLARGAELAELRTGDLAVQHDDGLYEIVGRRNRIAKIFGTRLDLDLAERMLADAGVPARLVGGSSALRVFVTPGSDPATVRDLVCAEHCLPGHAVGVETVEAFPSTANGKPDYAALSALPETVEAAPVPDVRTAFSGVFGREVADSDTFVSLGGDSLSYVETYVRLERLLGVVPTDWPERTVAELSTARRRPRRGWARLETPVVLRALAIALVVGSHVELWNVLGGAHTLLVLYGYGLARFALSAPSQGQRVRALFRSARELVIPMVAWVGGVALVTGTYLWSTPLLLNNAFGPDDWSESWQFWFLESAVWSTLLVVALVAVPVVDRLMARYPFAASLSALGLALAVRETWSVPTPMSYYALSTTIWCVALGWTIHVARSLPQRLVATALVPLCLYGYFPDDQARSWLVIGAVTAVIWVRHLPVPRPLDRLLAIVASASLFVYLTHWQVYPPLEKDHSFLAWAASLIVGVVAWALYSVVRRWLPDRLRELQLNRTGSASRP